jgi:hypothetical protein
VADVYLEGRGTVFRLVVVPNNGIFLSSPNPPPPAAFYVIHRKEIKIKNTK